MLHQCSYCNYNTTVIFNLRRHIKNKHGNHTVAASNPHPYVHPFLSHANQQVNTYPHRTPEMVANNTYYAEETRAPTKISVGPNGPRAPTTISVPPQIGGLQQGSGIGDQFHRSSQNSFHGARHDANNRASTKYHEPGSVQHGDGIKIDDEDFTFTRPPQCLSCRGHFYYRIIMCQYKVHINITRMEVVTSQIRKTW